MMHWITQRVFWCVLILCITAAASDVEAAAVIPPVEGVSSTGFTRIDFCQATEKLYAFSGWSLYRYDIGSDSFVAVLVNVGAATSKTWDPADFAFSTDGLFAALPTGSSGGFVDAVIPSGPATEKTGLSRNYFSTASRFRTNELYANGVASSPNFLFRLSLTGNGSEFPLCSVSMKSSGSLAFDAADNAYIADFGPTPDGLGKVDIYRISRGQLDNAAIDPCFVVTPQLLANDIVLAGSDSMAIDGSYNIYIGSYVGIAKIMPSPDPNVYQVVPIAGNITANPHQGWPPPSPVFCGITADIRAGILYYGTAVLNLNWLYDPYSLAQSPIVAVTDWPADLQGDGIINYADFNMFIADYLMTGSYLKGNLNNDTVVDLKDFAIFAKQWRNTAPWYQEN
jgi:hypothetical protein